LYPVSYQRYKIQDAGYKNETNKFHKHSYMEIYILRHAIAVQRGTTAYPNDDRPLTDEGIEKITEEAKGITKIIDGFDIILTSPLIRAHDTAKITAKELNCENKIEICKQLLPGSSIKSLFSYLSKYKNKEKILLVGHEPDLGYIASALLGIETSVIEFKKGALCRIDVFSIPPKEPGTLIWHLTPKQLRMLGK
jgi:phosphohistidine phosphatase